MVKLGTSVVTFSHFPSLHLCVAFPVILEPMYVSLLCVKMKLGPTPLTSLPVGSDETEVGLWSDAVVLESGIFSSMSDRR